MIAGSKEIEFPGVVVTRGIHILIHKIGPFIAQRKIAEDGAVLCRAIQPNAVPAVLKSRIQFHGVVGFGYRIKLKAIARVPSGCIPEHLHVPPKEDKAIFFVVFGKIPSHRMPVARNLKPPELIDPIARFFVKIFE